VEPVEVPAEQEEPAERPSEEPVKEPEEDPEEGTLHGVPRREFTDPNYLQELAEAKALKVTYNWLAAFKRRHDLPQGQTLNDNARDLLAQELETEQRVLKGERLKRDRALQQIAQMATLEVAQSIVAALPSYWSEERIRHISTETCERYLLHRVEDLTGKEYTICSAACKRAAKLAPDAAPAAPADPFSRALFWGVILRLDELKGAPPNDLVEFCTWSQLDAFKDHWKPSRTFDDVLAGRMGPDVARRLLELPETGPLAEAAIRSAYRTHARAHHPDIGGDRRRFEQLSEARDRLLMDH
jgi:hypothetical protein